MYVYVMEEGLTLYFTLNRSFCNCQITRGNIYFEINIDFTEVFCRQYCKCEHKIDNIVGRYTTMLYYTVMGESRSSDDCSRSCQTFECWRKGRGITLNRGT